MQEYSINEKGFDKFITKLKHFVPSAQQQVCATKSLIKHINNVMLIFFMRDLFARLPTLWLGRFASLLNINGTSNGCYGANAVSLVLSFPQTKETYDQ
jgi:hypothetical protein